MKNRSFGKYVAACGVLFASLFLSQLALAHHSFTIFDSTTEMTLTGVIKDFQWTNPHTFTWIEVKNDSGGTDLWGIEGMSPNYLGRRGWDKHTLKPGDHVSIVIYPLKDGKKGGTFLRVTMPDGTVKVMFGRPPK
jgi:hypothetical protein